MNIKQPAGFGSAEKEAESLTKDKSKISLLLTKAILKADRNKKSLMKVWNDLTTLFRLIRAWVSGKYRDVPWKTIVYAIGAVVYFVNPFDVIPDFIPIFGYLDDTGVVGFVIASIKGDITKFYDWEQNHI